MDALRQDFRYAIRSLLRAPAYSLIVIATLALGIGANATIFSLIDQVLLRPLPVRAPGELVQFDNPGAFMGRTMGPGTFSYPMYRDMAAGSPETVSMFARFITDATVTWQGEAALGTAEIVTGSYFPVLGLQPALGRLLSPDDDVSRNGHPVVVLSHGYWVRRFAGDPMVLNQTIRINGHPFTIVGVAPRGFLGVEPTRMVDLFVPVAMKAVLTPTWDDLDNSRSRWLAVFGRLRPGVSLEQARALLDLEYKRVNAREIDEMAGVPERFRERYLAKSLALLPAASGHQGFARRELTSPLMVLMAMVGVVLLIACANVSNLMLARAASQVKETAIRLSLGAGRWALVRQRLIESLVLAAAGGAAGLLLSMWLTSLLIAVMPGDPANRTLTAAVDHRIVLFTLAVSVLTALVFGVGPAWHSTRPSLAPALKEEAGTVSSGVNRSRFRRALVVAQVALSVLLVVCAALFTRSLMNLKSMDLGFDIDELVTFQLDPSLSGVAPARVPQIIDEVRLGLQALPGVRGASVGAQPVLSGDQWFMTIRIDGYEPRPEEDMNVSFNGVGAAYFSTLGVPLLAGREFDERDRVASPKVAIVSERLARHFFGSESPVGRRIGFGPPELGWLEIVGVVKDARDSYRNAGERFLFVPVEQMLELGAVAFYARIDEAQVAGFAEAARGLVKRVDGNTPLFGLRTVTEQAARSLRTERLVAWLSTAFGLLATLLAGIGLYGVMAYSVTSRTREIGIRMALGAERGRVCRMVVGDAARLVGVGIAVGLPLAVAGNWALRSQLFGLLAVDPGALAAAVAVLGAVAMVSAFLPARRATSVEPVRALRYE